MTSLTPINNHAAVIPFGDTLPAHIAALDSDLQAYTAGIGVGFPVLSIRGKTFALSRGGQRTIITRPDDPEAPANYVEVVFIKSNPAMSKVYYIKGYVEGSNERPDCTSSDGVRPDPGSPSPQSKSCATCPHNAFGSNATGKGKACSDSRRIAVAPLTALDDPMLLRVPASSFKNLVKYANYLSSHNIKSMAAVVTRIKFAADEATPLLEFSPRAFLAEDTLAAVREIANSELVAQIVGLAPLPRDDEEEALPLDLPKVSHTDVAKAVAAKPKVVEPEAEPELPKPAAKAAPKPAPKPKVDIEEVTAAVTKAKPAAPKPAPAADDMDSLNAALDDLLSEYDG